VTYVGISWPFTDLAQGELRCEKGGAVVIRIAGKDYAVNGAASSLYPPVQQIWNSDTYPNADIDRLIVKGLTLCDWGAPPPKHHYLSAHRQRVAHLNEQSGAGFGRGREAFPFDLGMTLPFCQSFGFTPGLNLAHALLMLASKKGDKPMALTPPSQVTFLLAVLLTVFSLLVHYANVAIPFVSGHSLLAATCRQSISRVLTYTSHLPLVNSHID
jgi:hypothetical protein